LENKDWTQEDYIREIARLNGIICDLNSRLKTITPMSREDKIKLSILKDAPYSMWACDRNFKIVIWTGNCERMYNISEKDAIGKNYLELFVDEYERDQSKIDCLRIIDKNYRQRNFLATDKKGDGSDVTVLTNCYRVYDEETNDYLQAEVGLDMGFDLEKANQIHRTLLEFWIKQKENNRQLLGYSKKELEEEVKKHFKKEKDNICEAEKCNLKWIEEEEIGNEFAEQSKKEFTSKSNKQKNEFEKQENYFLKRVADTEDLEELKRIKEELVRKENNLQLLGYGKKELEGEVKEHFKKEKDKVVEAAKNNLRWFEKLKEETSAEFAEQSKKEFTSKSNKQKNEFEKQENYFLKRVADAQDLEELEKIKKEFKVAKEKCINH
jgi:hypothetical protein